MDARSGALQADRSGGGGGGAAAVARPAADLRRGAYAPGALSTRPARAAGPAPDGDVGNLHLRGGGKTPLWIALAAHLRERGARVREPLARLSRAPALGVARGGRRRPGRCSTRANAGDEPLLIGGVAARGLGRGGRRPACRRACAASPSAPHPISSCSTTASRILALRRRPRLCLLLPRRRSDRGGRLAPERAGCAEPLVLGRRGPTPCCSGVGGGGGGTRRRAARPGRSARRGPRALTATAPGVRPARNARLEPAGDHVRRRSASRSGARVLLAAGIVAPGVRSSRSAPGAAADSRHRERSAFPDPRRSSTPRRVEGHEAAAPPRAGAEWPPGDGEGPA
jgi:hypothetical protein